LASGGTFSPGAAFIKSHILFDMLDTSLLHAVYEAVLPFLAVRSPYREYD
jgi:hypothetical protein